MYKRQGHGSKGIAADVQLVHTEHLGNEGRGKDECDDQRNVDGLGEHAEQVLVTKDLSSVVGTHADNGTIDLLQNVGDADHQVVFVGDQQLGSFDKTVLLVFLDFGFIRGVDKQMCIRDSFHTQAYLFALASKLEQSIYQCCRSVCSFSKIF